MSKEITGIMEDYLESIYCIIGEKGFARTKDLSQILGVSPPTVTEMLHKLDERGLIAYEPYSPVRLTGEGERIAKAIHKRHVTLTKLLGIILVSDKVADEDACRMEHILHPETIEQFSKLVEFVENAPHYPKWLKNFKHYCETGEYNCPQREFANR